MKIEIVTLFPDYFEMPLRQSLLGKALDKKLFEIEIINLREFATDKHKTVDDTPYGGGGGMVMKVEPIDGCLQHLGYSRLNENAEKQNERIILTSAAGKSFVQQTAVEYSLLDRICIICGHYLGVDERIMQLYKIDELSIGDYILTGGEPASLVMIEAVVRLIPKVLGNFESALDDSYMNQIIGTPCYTRPAEFDGKKVPDELLSGSHVNIKKFRRFEAIKKCIVNRPDLLQTADLDKTEKEMIIKAGYKLEDKE